MRTGVAIVLPLRSAIELMPLSPFTTSASALPMTSKIHGTWYAMPEEIPRDVGAGADEADVDAAGERRPR